MEKSTKRTNMYLSVQEELFFFKISMFLFLVLKIHYFTLFEILT